MASAKKVVGEGVESVSSPRHNQNSYKPFGDPDQYAEDYTAEQLKKRRQRVQKGNPQQGADANDQQSSKYLNHPIPFAKDSVSLISDVALKIKATRTSMAIGAPTFTWYLMVQLPLFVASMVFLLLAASMEAVSATADSSVILKALTAPLAGANYVLSLVGIDISKLSYDALLGAGAGLSMLNAGLALVFMFAAAIMYSLSGVHWLFGKHSALKIGFFLLAIIGYFSGIFQFIPWIFGWIFVVSLYPGDN